MPLYNRSLYLQVKEVLDENKAERHIRGGIATRIKYRGGRDEGPDVSSRIAVEKTADSEKMSRRSPS